MEKMILRLKIFHLSTITVTLLFATLLITIGTQLASYADTSQLLLSEDALKDPGSLAVKLQDTRAVISQHIATQLSAETQQLLGKYDGISSPSPELQQALILDLNKILQAGPLYDAESFAEIELSEQTDELLAQNPQSGEALVRLNRLLFSDAYPHEVASPIEKQAENPEGIEKCRENLRRIQLALEKYRDGTNNNPQWLSELVPEYLDKKDLLCPADATNGKPGVLTDGAADPTLPCSYLYQFRPSERSLLEMLQLREGGMLPIVRCEHHRLNLSINGKLYRQGTQRIVYNRNENEFSALDDFIKELRAEHGDAFIETPEGREQIKEVTEKLILKQFIPALFDGLQKKVLADIKPQIEAQIGEGVLETEFGQGILAQAMPQALEQYLAILDIDEKLRTQLKSQLGEEFFKAKEGQDILEQLSLLMSR